ncbi:hypothetical protein [Nocardia salmonicida]|uniref:hypothetical protein n=1 Tax=Nocardia salmonicida TaxID=53431 RepID=UPI00340A5F4A
MRRFTIACALAATVAGLTQATAHAEPAPPQGVNFTATPGDSSTTIATDAGSMVAEGGVFKIKAADGTVLAGQELSFRVDDYVFPIAAEITGRRATLTPRFDLEHAQYKPVALPYEDQAPWKTQYDREQAAWSRLTSTIALGASVGTLLGGIGGGAIGCVLGGIAGATIASATIIGMFGPFIPAAAVGCVAGVMAIGALGTVAGQLLVTAPVAVLAAVQYLSTINTPMAAK